MKDQYPGVWTVVKCDLQSADVEMDSGACLYDDGKNKSLSILLNEFTDWLAVLSSITVVLHAISCWLCRLGPVCFLSACLFVGRSVGQAVGRSVGWLVRYLILLFVGLLACSVVSFAGCLIATWMVACLLVWTLVRLIGWLVGVKASN
jgi:hypothetical protein